MPEFLTGQLLVASPTLIDPNFARSVVLVIDHDDDGALGLVLNRPTEADLLDHVPGWWGVAAQPQVVFIGGPVGEGGGIGLARGSGGVPMDGWPEVLGMQAVDLEADPGPDANLEARVFAGYSGWSPGQLEHELQTGSWIVVPAVSDDVFTADPHDLWADVLRRSGGRNAWVSTYPTDPRLN